MNLDNIQKESYELYCQYQDYCANLGIGIAQNYSMLKKQILEHHNRKISFDPKMMMFYTYLDNKKKLYCKTEDGLIDKLVSYYLKNCAGLYSFDALFQRSITYNRDHDFLADSTIDRYTADYVKYIEPAIEFAQDIRNITAADITHFLARIMKEKISSKVYANIKTVIRMVFSYARVQEGVECLYVNSVLKDIQFPRRAFKPKEIPTDRVFTDSDVSAVFQFLDPDVTVDLGIKFCFYTGLRVGELCALRCEDFDLPRRTVNIMRSETVSGKGKQRVYVDAAPKCNKTREVVLSDPAIEIARMLCTRSTGFIFAKGNTHLHARTFDSRLRRLCKSIGLPAYSMHDIRRTFATHMLDSDVPESFVQNQMGHSDIRTTRSYYYYSTKKHNDYIEYANKSAI